jgi:hypothetical protein
VEELSVAVLSWCHGASAMAQVFHVDAAATTTITVSKVHHKVGRRVHWGALTIFAYKRVKSLVQ